MYSTSSTSTNKNTKIVRLNVVARLKPDTFTCVRDYNDFIILFIIQRKKY